MSLAAKLGGKYRVLFAYTSSSLAMVTAGAISNVLVMRWLEPVHAGVWQSMMAFHTYGLFLQLGVFNGLNREYPFLLGRDEAEQARCYVATAKTYAVCCALVAVLAFSVAALFFWGDEYWRKGLLATGLMTAFVLYQRYLLATFRAGSAFQELSKANFIYSLSLFLTIPLVWRWGFDGLCARIVLTYALQVLILQWRAPVRVGFGLDLRILKVLVFSGGPLIVSGLVVGAASTFDRMLLLEVGGAHLVGLLAPAIAVRNALGALPMSIHQYIFPAISQQLGKGSSAASVWSTSWKATLGSALVLVPFVGIGMLLLPPAVDRFYPAYSAGNDALLICLVGSVFLGANAGIAAIPSLKAWGPLTVWSLASVVLLWALPLGFSRMSDPVTGVALGWALSRAALFVIALALIYWATRRPLAGAR